MLQQQHFVLILPMLIFSKFIFDLAFDNRNK